MSGEAPPPPRIPNPVVSAGWKLSAVFALLLIGLLVAGWILPGTWSAEATRTVAAPAERVYALLDSPARWNEWAPWPDIPYAFEGPERGAGARRSWDAPDFGSGSHTITAATPPTSVSYRVEMDGGQVLDGDFRLAEEDGGTRVTWSERGDFGANPVLAWAALSMRRRHGAELARQLETLEQAARAP